MRNVKLGLIGAGNIGNLIHYPILSKFQDVELSALCDRDKTSLLETAKKFKIEKTYTDYEKMLNDTSFDAVYILVQPHHVFDIVMECLERKINVFIEKPPGITVQQAYSMAKAAYANGCLTMVGFQRRFSPVLQEARNRVEEHGDMMQFVLKYVKNKLSCPAYYKGAVDILTCDVIHAVDLLRWAGGEIEKISSTIDRYYSEQNNAFNALIKFKSGATGFLISNWAAGKREFSLELYSRGISAVVDPDRNAVLYKDNNEEGYTLTARTASGSNEEYKHKGFFYENRHFIDCITNKTLPYTNFSDALKTMELVDRIYHSSI